MSTGIRVGTSGWSYGHWDGAFYPNEVSARKRLDYYTTQFPTVEINATFYRLPSQDAVRSWHDTVPDRFRFAAKGSRAITHYHRLADATDQIHAFMRRIGALKSFLDVVLWQLPPTLSRDDHLLDAFLGNLPRSHTRHAVEFRHESWLAEEVFAIMRHHRASNVQVSSSQMPEDLTVTSDLVYVRLHGLEGDDHDYSSEQLRPWADFLTEQHAAGRACYVYFNNDARARAPKNARSLIEMLGESALPWSSDT